MKALSLWLLPLAMLCLTPAPASAAQVSSLRPDDIIEFNRQPAEVQAVLRYALDLTRKDLSYKFGGCEIHQGGMDCSGTVFHILRTMGMDDVPRQSNHQYLWVKEHGNLNRVKRVHQLDDRQLSGLKPGDLLFWEGTYNVGKRNPPTSHVMIFLGHRKSDGRPVMVGASSGRRYAGKSRHGVSVFDFTVPRKGSRSSFVAYGTIPGLERARGIAGGSSNGAGLFGRVLGSLPWGG